MVTGCRQPTLDDPIDKNHIIELPFKFSFEWYITKQDYIEMQNFINKKRSTKYENHPTLYYIQKTYNKKSPKIVVKTCVFCKEKSSR